MQAPFNGWFAVGQRPVVMKEHHEKCPSCKGKVRFLCSSSKLISQPTGAPSRDDASSHGLQNPKSRKAPGDTNSEQDIRIPAIYVKNCDPWLEPVNTNKTNKQTAYPYTAWRNAAQFNMTWRFKPIFPSYTVHSSQLFPNAYGVYVKEGGIMKLLLPPLSSPILSSYIYSTRNFK